jgi:hypothetical protein
MEYPSRSRDPVKDDLERRVTERAFFAGAGLTAVSLVAGGPILALGTWAGSLISILNLKLLMRNTGARFSPLKERLYQFFLLFIIRYGIIAILLWLAVTKELIFFIGMALGLFTVIPVMLVDIYRAAPRKR